MSTNYQLSKVSNRIVKSEIREILKLTRKPGIISFGGGLPDASLFPIQDIINITKEVLEKKSYLALQYGPTQGEAEMLEALCFHLNSFGENVKPEQVCVTSSSQQGLDLISLLFIDEESPIIMELPSYLGGIQAFRRCGADMIGVPMDEDGMLMEALEEKLNELKKKGQKPRFIYTIPDFQNPAGYTMSLERRKKLIQIAKEREILIIEDSPYRELTFKGELLPSLWMLSGGEGVLMLKTFSKVLFPGMRMGWVVAEKALIDKIEMLKQSVDLCTPAFNQLILSNYIMQGKMKETINKAIECYKPKSAAMLKALDTYMPKEVSWSKPYGGMFLWVTLPKHVDAMDVFMKAIEHNVAYVIGRPFHCNGEGGNTLRLNYSFPSVEQIDLGIKRLADAIRESL